MQIKKTVEGFIQYLLMAGFLLFGGGILMLILRAGMPAELTMIAVGVVLIIFGILIAKIFGGVVGGRH